jgi:XTP/dITP diphosphohydrolase
MAMGKVEGLLCEHGPDVGRAAHFACVLALAWPDGVDAVYEGRVDGTMTWPPRGRLGFGFDPVFIPRGYKQTFAEIPPPTKPKSATVRMLSANWWPISLGKVFLRG